MASQAPKPDTIKPQSPPEKLPAQAPQEDPVREPDEIVPPQPGVDNPDGAPIEIPQPDTGSPDGGAIESI